MAVAGLGTGAAFTRLRISAGLSAHQLAKAAGVSKDSVCRVERGGYVTRKVRDALVATLGEDAQPLIPVRADWPDTAVSRARRASGESTRVAAERAGVSVWVFGRAERGESIHPANAKRIAEAFGLDVLDVLPPKERRPA